MLPLSSARLVVLKHLALHLVTLVGAQQTLKSSSIPSLRASGNMLDATLAALKKQEHKNRSSVLLELILTATEQGGFGNACGHEQFRD